MRVPPRGQPFCTSALPACPVLLRSAFHRHRSLRLTCRAFADGLVDMLLSLSSLPNESPLRSVPSSFAPRGVPILPPASDHHTPPPRPCANNHPRPVCADTDDLSIDALSWPPVLNETLGSCCAQSDFRIARAARSALGSCRSHRGRFLELCTAVPRGIAAHVPCMYTFWVACALPNDACGDSGGALGLSRTAQGSRAAVRARRDTFRD